MDGMKDEPERKEGEKEERLGVGRSCEQEDSEGIGRC
jgi:hypothetical protein